MKRIMFVRWDYGKLTKHFNSKEFRCKDGNENLLICEDLVTVLEMIREHFNAPVKINSGYRTPSWNIRTSGAPDSMHCNGMAADIVVEGHSSKEVAKYASELMDALEYYGGVIRYTNFTHVDVREERYRKGV